MTISGYIIIALLVIIIFLFIKITIDKKKKTQDAIDRLNDNVVEMFTSMRNDITESLTFVRNDVNRLDNHFNTVTKSITKVFENGTKKMKDASKNLGFEKDQI